MKMGFELNPKYILKGFQMDNINREEGHMIYIYVVEQKNQEAKMLETSGLGASYVCIFEQKIRVREVSCLRREAVFPQHHKLMCLSWLD